MLIKDVLKWGHETLLLTSDSARLDAEVVLAHVLKKPTTFLLSHNDSEVGFWSLWRYKRLIERRKKGEPVAYLVGHKEFFCLDLAVNRHVLVPRPDTEILVGCVISYFKSEARNSKHEKRCSKSDTPSKNIRISNFGFRDFMLLDIGTGSGCIPIAVCKNVEGLKAMATDISSKALSIARKNVKKHGLMRRIQLVKSDLLEGVDLGKIKGKNLIVTANLPYIPVNFQVSPELAYEPSISLYGGDDGADVYRKLTEQLKEIKPRVIFFELFEEQIAILKPHLPDYRLKYVENMSGNARVLCMERGA